MEKRKRLSEEDFDALVNSIREKANQDALEAYGEKGFERWQNPRFHIQIHDYDVKERLKGSCGDSIELSLKFEDGRVKDGSYFTDGCASSGLAGSFTIEKALGRTPEDLLELKDVDILDAIGTFPAKDRHCAGLAISVLHACVDAYMKKQVGR